LFDSAFEVIAHGINMRREQILGEEELSVLVEKNQKVIDFDLDELYEVRVKSLYAAIIAFISKAQSLVPSMFAEELYHLRSSASGVVESVKHVKHMRKNTSRYMASQNVHIKREYNKLRLRIATILREIYRYRDDIENSLAVLELDGLKVEAAEAKIRMNEHVSAMLRKEEITALMATSLLNDFNYANEAADSLIYSAQSLLAVQNSSLSEAARDVILSEDEVKAISD
jgi:phosphate:Na+ symporter